jgi:hypothetical protein
MTNFDREACRRLPLADGVLRLLDYATNDDLLNSTFDSHRGRSYEGVITFTTFFRLIRDTLLQQEASAHQCFRQAREDGDLTACFEAMYGKLRRVPPSLSQGLLLNATSRLCEVLPDAQDPVPASLSSFEVLAFDGKKLKYVAKRLKALRPIYGRVLGGKLLVVQNVATKLAVAFESDMDGEAADNGLVEGAVKQVRAQGGTKPRLWIADRLFCDLNQIPLLAAGGDYFLLRYQSKVGFHADSERPARSGKTTEGLTYQEEWGWLGAVSSKRRQYVRRIRLERPGEEAILVVTNLLDADLYPATDLLAAYRRRWGIETMFQQATDVFDLRHLISGTPQATIFQASFVLLLHNVIQVMRGFIAEADKRNPETISTQNLFQDVVKQLSAWTLLVDEDQTLSWLRDGVQTAAQVRAYLRKRLARVWTKRWEKAPTKKRKPKARHTDYLKGGHSSVYRILRGEHELVPEPEPAER